MSADNWALCPQCEINHNADVIRRNEALKESYGKVPAEEYVRLWEELRAWEKEELASTLREDFKVGVTLGEGEDSGGRLYIVYVGHCTVCDFHYEYEDGRSLNITPQITKLVKGKRRAGGELDNK